MLVVVWALWRQGTWKRILAMALVAILGLQSDLLGCQDNVLFRILPFLLLFLCRCRPGAMGAHPATARVMVARGPLLDRPSSLSGYGHGLAGMRHGCWVWICHDVVRYRKVRPGSRGSRWRCAGLSLYVQEVGLMAAVSRNLSGAGGILSMVHTSRRATHGNTRGLLAGFWVGSIQMASFHFSFLRPVAVLSLSWDSIFRRNAAEAYHCRGISASPTPPSFLLWPFSGGSRLAVSVPSVDGFLALAGFRRLSATWLPPAHSFRHLHVSARPRDSQR